MRVLRFAAHAVLAVAATSGPVSAQPQTLFLPDARPGDVVAGAPGQVQPVFPASGANERARFLSGLRLPEGSVLAPLQQAPWYLDHTANYATTWRRFDEQYFSKMRAWSAAEVAPRIGTARTVFYLFGGPDFINAYALFPEADVYVLGGLEPVGNMPPPERLGVEQIVAGLENLRQSTSVTLQFSHFITRDMKVELERTEFKGVTPILMSFLALGGAEILSVDAIAIDRSGALSLVSGAAAPADASPGVRIVFRKDPESPRQTLFYVRADVSDSGLAANSGLLAWMGALGPAVSYLKAASYLMHEPYFSRVRAFLLANSRAILQDDSGIPLRAFGTGQWELFFFGDYSGTLEIFKKYEQADLAEAFRRPGSVFPLPFGTGYKWRQGESNLMLAVRLRRPAE